MLDRILGGGGEGVRLVTERHPVRFAAGSLELLAAEIFAADAVVSLPLLRGPYLPGLPHDADGFLRVLPCPVPQEQIELASGRS